MARHQYLADSPISQYRKKGVFCYLPQFVVKHEVSFAWVYLEHNHGKGIPDGIGARGCRMQWRHGIVGGPGAV